jgi:hypothetical protein
MAPWADALYACDSSWWNNYFAEVCRTFKGPQLWTISTQARDQYKIHWILGNSNRSGLSNSNDWIVAGKNSGYQSIGLAIFFGCKRVILLGYDFQRSGGKAHWHADHPRTMGNGGRFHDWVKDMDPLARATKEAGIDVINCSRTTAIKSFPRATIQDVL